MIDEARLSNLQAWAVTLGYDPARVYTVDVVPAPDGDRLSAHFTAEEFACHHCRQLPNGMPSQTLIELLENVRAHFGGRAVTVNSGYRCATHNKAVGGAPNSQHLYGIAADIVVAGVPPSMVYAYLDPFHDGGLGSYKSFTHIDMRDGRARWSG